MVVVELVDHHQLVAEGVVGEVLCLEVLVAPLQVVLEVLMMVPKVALVLLVVLQMKLVVELALEELLLVSVVPL